MNEKLREKLAERAGFYSKVVTNKSADFNGIYMDKDGMFKKMPDTYEKTLWHDPEITPDSGCRDYWYAEDGLPNFPKSLDACIKWLVPKVDWQQIIFQPDGYCGITANDELYEAEAETQALAFCLATEKLIDGEK